MFLLSATKVSKSFDICKYFKRKNAPFIKKDAFHKLNIKQKFQ